MKLLNIIILIFVLFSIQACTKAGSYIDEKNAGSFNSQAVEGKNVYLSYYDEKSKNLVFAKSDNEGSSWDKKNTKIADPEKSVGQFSSIAVKNSNVYISYLSQKDLNLKFARSIDNGLTWKKDELVLVDLQDKTGKFSSIAASDNNVYIAYPRLDENKLMLAISRDQGKTWPVENIKIVDGSGDSKGGRNTSIIADGESIYIVYNGAYNGRGNGKSLKFTKSKNHGNNWKTSEIDGPECSVGLFTSMALNEGSLYVSYAAKYDLRLAVSQDSGATWKIINKIDTTQKRSQIGSTSISIINGNICIAYMNKNQPKFAISRDKGLTWKISFLSGAKQNKKRKDRAKKNVGIKLSSIQNKLLLSYYNIEEKKLVFLKSSDSGKTWK